MPSDHLLSSPKGCIAGVENNRFLIPEIPEVWKILFWTTIKACENVVNEKRGSVLNVLVLYFLTFSKYTLILWFQKCIVLPLNFLYFWQKSLGTINISQSLQVKNISGKIEIDLLNKPDVRKYKHKIIFVFHFSQYLENSGYLYDFSGHKQQIQTSSIQKCEIPGPFALPQGGLAPGGMPAWWSKGRSEALFLHPWPVSSYFSPALDHPLLC